MANRSAGCKCQLWCRRGGAVEHYPASLSSPVVCRAPRERLQWSQYGGQAEDGGLEYRSVRPNIACHRKPPSHRARLSAQTTVPLRDLSLIVPPVWLVRVRLRVARWTYIRRPTAVPCRSSRRTCVQDDHGGAYAVVPAIVRTLEELRRTGQHRAVEVPRHRVCRMRPCQIEASQSRRWPPIHESRPRSVSEAASTFTAASKNLNSSRRAPICRYNARTPRIAVS